MSQARRLFPRPPRQYIATYTLTSYYESYQASLSMGKQHEYDRILLKLLTTKEFHQKKLTKLFQSQYFVGHSCPDSGIREIFACDGSRILCFGRIQFKESLTPLKTVVWNPSSADKESAMQY